jgi:hypothetical protein
MYLYLSLHVANQQMRTDKIAFSCINVYLHYSVAFATMISTFYNTDKV